MIETTEIKPPVGDLAQRVRALGLTASFLVRAPAGSGKTDLLTRRFLKLLAAVDEPEQILAITFTRAATAEMRSRVLHYLEQAAQHPPAETEDPRITLARAALAQSERRGWQLLEQPHRLNIETIDSLCLRIAHGQPRLARMGGQLAPVEQAGPLYAQAARRTLGRLGGSDAELNAALTHLLALRDNNLRDCEALLAEMLAQRDRWIRAFPLAGALTEDEWTEIRQRLEAPFRREVQRVLGQLRSLLAEHPVLVSELLELSAYACLEPGDLEIGVLDRLQVLPTAESIEHWIAFASLLLTREGEWRKQVDKRCGFPSQTTEHKFRKKRMMSLIERLAAVDGLLELLCAVRNLPLPRYDEHQWRTLRHLFMALRQAAAELRVLFAEQNGVDFTEIGLAARDVLSSEDASPDVDRLLATSGNIHHLLIDEFQDTSRSQHDLVRLLVRAWDQGDGRTCFLVGDPMQSIYLFRQAEVELFYQVEKVGLGPSGQRILCEPIQLTTNFRSHSGLTERWNEIFAAVFAAGDTGVPFSPSFASEAALPGTAVQVHPQLVGSPGQKPTPEERQQARSREAEQALAVIEQHWPAIEEAQQSGGEYRVAILVRARNHLAEIVRQLRLRAIPFRAVELETLAERQELLDLRSLTRALLHPMDRIAWLSVLRAPWCGLTLRDLHILTGQDDPACRRMSLLELFARHAPLLESEAARRAARTIGVLTHALAERFAGPHAASFSQWIERAWRSLGGAQCVDAAGYENAQVYFTLLDAVAPDGIACLSEDFDAEFDRLFAQPDPTVNERAGVQLMTIHKAKGLGFDVVILPGLDRKPAGDRPSLVVSLERDAPPGNGLGQDPDRSSEMLVAPIGGKGDEKHPTYAWVQRLRNQRADEERKRVLYVACTRARRELHLLGTATVTAAGIKPGDAKSLLAAAWSALEPDFAAIPQAEPASPGNLLQFPTPTSEIDGDEIGLDIAAAAEPAAEEHAPELTLRRLREPGLPAPKLRNVTTAGKPFRAPEQELHEPQFARPEGSRRARTIGSAVHALLDAASRGAEAPSLHRRARLLLRGASWQGKILEDAVREALEAVETTRSDPHGAWILRPRADAASETSWTGWFDGSLQTLRADRVFTAGPEPGSEGAGCAWIIDYKMTAPAGEAVAAFLARQRELYAPQLQRYARALNAVRSATGTTATPIHLGLYYPRIGRLDWWKPE